MNRRGPIPKEKDQIACNGVVDDSMPEDLAQMPNRTLARAVKRIADIAFASTLLVISCPLLGILAILVRRDGGPALFRQQRVGLGGKIFEILKLRTMMVDAESVLAQDADMLERYMISYSLDDDTRATRLGAILRVTHLDEIPQFWNVVRGEMSLVGPRPVLAHEAEEYGPLKRRILSVQPGMTGLWQINRHYAPQYPERAYIEANYVEGWSLLLDARLAVSTVAYVLTKIRKRAIAGRSCGGQTARVDD